MRALTSFLIAATFANAAFADCERVYSRVTHLGERYRVGISLPPDNDDQQVPHPGARYLRLRLKVDSLGGCDWYVVVRDHKYRPVEVIPRSRFDPGLETWTTRIETSNAYVDYQRCDGVSPTLTVVEYVAMPQKVSNPYYSLKNFDAGPDYLELYGDYGDAAKKRLGDHVGMFMSKWAKSAWSCSGVLLSPTLFLTNWHCGGPKELDTKLYWNPEVLRDAIVDLSWDLDPVSNEYRVIDVVAQDDDLDFAILRLKPLNASSGGRPARIRKTPLTASDILTVVHHPAALPKQFSDCAPIDLAFASWQDGIAGTDFTHRCDTESGSSGGAVFDANGFLVGLHHDGFRFDETSCKQIDAVNKAVHLPAILRFLKNRPVLQELGISLQ